MRPARFSCFEKVVISSSDELGAEKGEFSRTKNRATLEQLKLRSEERQRNLEWSFLRMTKNGTITIPQITGKQNARIVSVYLVMNVIELLMPIGAAHL